MQAPPMRDQRLTVEAKYRHPKPGGPGKRQRGCERNEDVNVFLANGAANMKRDSISPPGIIPAKKIPGSFRARPVKSRVRPYRLGMTAATVSTTAVLVIAGCGGHQAAVPLPSDSPPARPSSPSVSAAASAQTTDTSVVSAYKGFLDAANRAISAPPEQTRQILQDYAAGDFLEFQIRQVAVHQRAHEEPWGKAIVHITQVTTDGSTAVLHDCQDDSAAGLADQRTHLLINKSRGRANQHLVADMTKGGDGKWRVSGLRLHRSACHVP